MCCNLTLLACSGQRRDNPVELMKHKLARSSSGMADRNLKPSIVERKQIGVSLLLTVWFPHRSVTQVIIESPDKRLSFEQKQLLWRFRYSLVGDKRVRCSVSSRTTSDLGVHVCRLSPSSCDVWTGATPVKRCRRLIYCRAGLRQPSQMYTRTSFLQGPRG